MAATTETTTKKATSLFAKLAQVQQKLNAPKNQRNTFGGYNYRSCEDIYNAVKPLLAEVGCSLIVTDEIVVLGERTYVKATAFLYGLDNPGTSIQVTAYAREEDSKKGMDASQVTGAASSYARKYALNGLFLIDDVKDSDATNTHGNEAPAKSRVLQEKRLTKERYESAVLGAATGETYTDKSGRTMTYRELFIARTNATPEYLKQFDADVAKTKKDIANANKE